VDPSDDHRIRDNCVPAIRIDGSGITPGRQHLSMHSINETDSVFKVPSQPNDTLVRSLKFQEDKNDIKDETWTYGEEALKTLEAQPSGTPNWAWDKRLSALNARNWKQPPHLKSSYPVEIQSLPADVKDEELKNASNYEPPPSVQDSVQPKAASQPNENSTRKKTVSNQKSPGRFFSRFAKFGNNDSKEIPRDPKQNNGALPRPAQKGVKFDVTFTPPAKDAEKKTGKVPPAKKKCPDTSTAANGIKARKMNGKK